jgi:hypothetical protein
MQAAQLQRPAGPDDTPSDVVRRAVELISERLPTAWNLDLRREIPLDGRRRADAIVDLRTPDGETAVIVIEAKTSIEVRDARAIAEQLDSHRAQIEREAGTTAGLLAAPYINPALRVRLVELGQGYADATGNLRLQLDRPALFIRDSGADRNPWRGPGRPRGSFKGGTAARVFRGLVDFKPPYSVPQLVKRSGASTGVAYRVVEFLEREDIVARKERDIVRVDWRQLVERWSQEYGFALSISTSAFIEPRGLDVAAENLRTSNIRYAVTGSSAAEYYAPYAPVRALSLYVDSIPEAVNTLGLRPAATGGNVLVAVPEDPVAFKRINTFNGLSIAAPSQVAVDLLGGPGRAPEEGRVLLDWMEANESAWRA